MQDAYVSCIKNTMNPSQLLRSEIQKMLSTQVSVSNPIDFTKMLSTTSFQNLTYLDLLMIYASDLSLMTRLSLFNPVLSYSYTLQIGRAQNASHLSGIIDEAIQHTQKLSVIVHSVLMVVIALLLIPLGCLLHKRLLLHEKVYDLLVSIDPVQVQGEIKSLQYIDNILRNYKESNETIKMNVIGYQQNVIQPKQRKSMSSASADNEMILGLSRYDIANVQQQHPFIRSQIKKESIHSMIQRSFTKTQMLKTVQKRKRSGQLDLAGSDLDPKKKIKLSHCALYIISLSFLVILGLSLYYQRLFNATYLQGKHQLLETYNNQIKFESFLIISKVLLSVGSKFFASFFGYPDALPFIYNILQEFPIYDYHDNLNIYSTILPNCTNGTNIPNFAEKYCQYDYSTIVLVGQFGTIFKDLMEMRYNLDQGVGNLSYGSTILNINEKLFYLQSLNLQLQEMVMLKVNYIFSQLIKLSIAYNDYKTTILVTSVVWGVLSCALGLLLILRMKEQYFKEVFMITFLNNEMITKNKRVQSFLDSIAKSISP